MSSRGAGGGSDAGRVVMGGGGGVPGAVLEARGVSVRFGGVQALDGAFLVVGLGSTVGLIGPNGAGKSTFLGVLSGTQVPQRGSVYLDGQDVTGLAARQRALRGLARTFQLPEMFSSLTVREHLVVAYRARHQPRRFLSDLATLGSLRRGPAAEREVVDSVLEMAGLAPYADRVPEGLSLGAHRLVEIGRAVASGPRVVLLDEPGSGLHGAARERLADVLAELGRRPEVSVVLVEHDVDLVLSLSQQVFVLDFGAVIASGTPDEIRGSRAVQEAYLGTAPEGPGRAS
jgi:ABC-type branched-subunit amino acid transport system ATPase component